MNNFYEEINSLSSAELSDRIKKWAQSYYTGNPEIGNHSFNLAVDVLRDKDPRNSVLHTVGWGFDVSKVDRKKSSHKYSLVGGIDSKVKTEEEILKLCPNDQSYSLTHKFDGTSFTAYYVNGVLEKALTRGDGETGLDITAKLRHTLPASIPVEHDLAVRGEVVINLKTFRETNPDAANARNSASGLLYRLYDPDDFVFESLEAIACRIHGGDLPSAKTHYDYPRMLHDLKSWGFKTPFFMYIQQSDRIYDSIELFMDKYPLIDYLFDGIVITANHVLVERYKVWSEIKYQDVAYKFEDEHADVTVRDIEWTLSRTGMMVPVVIFDECNLAGAMVTRATGFDAGNIIEKGIGVGAKIKVVRSGAVIPYIIDVLVPKPSPLPMTCPVCYDPLEMVGSRLFCTNKNCSNRSLSQLFWWSYTVAPVDGLSDVTLTKLFEFYDINSVIDLYRVRNFLFDYSEDIAGPHAATLIRKYFEKLTEPIDPNIFLAAFGIRTLGETWSKALAPYIFDIAKGNIDESCSDIPGLPYTVVNGLKENLQFIKDVLSFVILDTLTVEDSQSSKVKIVCTGKLSKTRSKLAEEWSKIADMISHITSDVDYLVTDNPNSGSSKNKSALEYGVKVISESQFREIMNL